MIILSHSDYRKRTESSDPLASRKNFHTFLDKIPRVALIYSSTPQIKNGNGISTVVGEMAKHFLKVPFDTYLNTAVKVMECRIRRDR
jgi:hypothetical protein